MNIRNDIKLDFDDVLIQPKSSGVENRSPDQVNLVREFTKFPHSTRSLTCVPIIASNMDVIGTFKMANVLSRRGWITCLNKHYPIEQLVRYYSEEDLSFLDKVFYSLGISANDIIKLQTFITHVGYCPNLCVDVANGYTDNFINQLRKIRRISPRSIILAGNIATCGQVENIIRHGTADIVKVGIGSGSVCTTRIVTGVGYPQLSATIECTDAAHGNSRGYVCSDGGIKNSGDINKALGANADFVMLGSMLAGCDECDGEWEWTYEGLDVVKTKGVVGYGLSPKPQNKKSLKYYGMSSYSAQDKYNGGKSYRPSEGKMVTVPYKGHVKSICDQVEGAIRSCCSYIGANKIKDMGRCTTFIRVNRTHNTLYSTEEFRT